MRRLEWSSQLSAQGNFAATVRSEPKLSRALSELRRQRSELQTTGKAEFMRKISKKERH